MKPFYNVLNQEIKGRLGNSSLEDWPSFLENSPGETMRPLFHASLLERINAYLRTPRGLAVACIWWILFLLGLVFVCIRLISWEIRPKASSASSTAASLLGKDLGGWRARRLFCSVLLPCDALSPFSEEGPSNLRYEIQPEEVKYVS